VAWHGDDLTKSEAADIARELDRLIAPRAWTATGWVGEQRHISFRIDAGDGKPWGWLKVERDDGPFAGLGIESRVIEQAARLGIAPRLIAAGRLSSGREFVITEHVDGVLLADHPTAEAAPLVLAALGVLAGSGFDVPRHSGTHLFSAHPDLRQIWADARADAGLPADAPRAGAFAIKRDAQDSVPIHGSLSVDNVVISSGQAILLDWEAARVGDPAFDLASIVGECGENDKPEDARVWRTAITQWARSHWDDDRAELLDRRIDAWLQIRVAHRAIAVARAGRIGSHGALEKGADKHDRDSEVPRQR
jgi:Ser/Thr protein kinase RdoA (MazF antagonist)